MRIKRTTKIAVEIEQEWTIRTRSARLDCWCGPCGRQVQFVALEEAAAMASVSSGILSHWIALGRLHSAQAPAGSTMICLSSLIGQIYDHPNEKEK